MTPDTPVPGFPFVPGAPLAPLVLSFAFYGFAGWAWESTVCSFAERRTFVNSGFLLGPCCPIYGVGALACWLALRRVPSVAAQFVLAALVCSAIEYAVGACLERLTGARFWNYSNLPFNIRGRVCLYGALLFGAGSVAVCRAVEPWLLGALSWFPAPALDLAALAVLVGVAVDAAVSIASWKRLSVRLDAARSDLAERMNGSLEGLSDKVVDSMPAELAEGAAGVQMRTRALNGWLMTVSDAALDALRERVGLPSFILEGARSVSLTSLLHGVSGKLSLSRRELRFFNAFPQLRYMAYEGVIRATGLRDRVVELFGRKK